jgi:hypothetical protein
VDAYELTDFGGCATGGARYRAAELASVEVVSGGKEERPYCSYSGRGRSDQLRGWRILPRCEVADDRFELQVARSNSAKTWPSYNGT